MYSYSAVFSLFAASLINGTPVHSNSPHSPYTQLKVLTEDVKSLKESLAKMKSSEDISETLLNENKQLASKVEKLEQQNKQLEDKNKNLQNQLTDLDEIYKKQTQDLLALSKEFQQFRSKANENNTTAIKNRELVSVKKDISQIKESLSSTQNEIGTVERRLVDDGVRNSQNFQNQLQNVKKEFLEFCKATNQKLQDFSEQIQSNLAKASYEGCVKKHTIASGESLASIARLYGTTPDQILSANHLTDIRGLHVGDVILVP